MADPSRTKAERELRKVVKLSKRRHRVKCGCGCEVVVTGHPTDGKPGALIEASPGSTISHESLTPPPASV